MPILARQQSFIQLCWKYKHDHNNKGRIMDTIKKRERRGGKQVVRVKPTKEDKRWQPWNVEDLMISIVVCGFYLDRETNTNTATTCSLLLCAIEWGLVKGKLDLTSCMWQRKYQYKDPHTDPTQTQPFFCGVEQHRQDQKHRLSVEFCLLRTPKSNLWSAIWTSSDLCIKLYAIPKTYLIILVSVRCSKKTILQKRSCV